MKAERHEMPILIGGVGVAYAGIVVDVKAKAVDRLFHYSIPDRYRSDLQLGHRVLVPFGRRLVEGYVVELNATPTISLEKIRPIQELLDREPILDPRSLDAARWMAARFQGYWVEALQNFLPPGSRYGRERARVKKEISWSLTRRDAIDDVLADLPKNAVRQRDVVRLLAEHDFLSQRDLIQMLNCSPASLASLEQKGYLTRGHRSVERQPQWGDLEVERVKLTMEQQRVLSTIEDELREGKGRPILLHGVTGSGKTEVYLQLLEGVLSRGQQGIIMVPEISLTPQTVSRFRGRFGSRIAVLHSGLSAGERFDQWWKIRRGEVSIAIGARSAVFAPFGNLGLIILDEEHETTYKQEDGSLKYHARDVAEYRAEQHGAQVILGSATPSMESYQKALRGQYRLCEMMYRVEHRAMPRMNIVDMRREFAQGHRHMFSRVLQDRITANWQSGHQSIIFLNRRGFASFVLCRSCGHVVECPNCKVSLTLHKHGQKDRLHCHYCGLTSSLPEVCPECASKYLRSFGSGTQQVEEALHQLVPGIRSVRMDADTTTTKGAHQKLLDVFRKREADVLIGTQMIAKGLDFPYVTLVGVLAADLSLNFPDFRAAERTFQLLTQISGRAGRGAHPGDVYIQCYDPSHRVIEAVKTGDYKGFFRQEISFRREAGYPPTTILGRIVCSGPEDLVKSHCYSLTKWFGDNQPNLEVIGPTPAPIARIKGKYRWHVLLRTSSRTLIPNDFLEQWPKAPKDISVSFDLDPLYLL